MPAHNEADAIETVVREFRSALSNQTFSHDIVVVEDGSTDGTKEILQRLQTDLGITVDMSDSRRGYSEAVIRGAELVDSDYLLFTDSDGQHFAADALKLWAHRNDAPIIVGGRYDRAEPFHRRLLSLTFQSMSKAMFSTPPVEDLTAPFRLVEREAALDIIPSMAYMRESFWTEFSIRAHYAGFAQLEVPVRHTSRRGPGTTRVYSPRKIPVIAFSQTIGLVKLYRELHS